MGTTSVHFCRSEWLLFPFFVFKSGNNAGTPALDTLENLMTRILSVFAISFLLFASPLSAAMMNYGDVMGSSYTYVDVTEDNLEEDLYYDGGISSAGDTLLIDPDGFGVQVNPGAGVDLLDSELEMMIIPKNDTASVDKIFFDEEGDFTIVGGGMVEAAVSYFWQIVEINGTSVDPIGGNGSANFSSTDAGAGQLWSIDFALDLSGEKPNPDDRITKVNFRFDNTLTSQAGDGEIAFIKKKQTGGVRVCTTGVNGEHTDCMIPEPGSMSLLLISLLGAIAIRRR